MASHASQMSRSSVTGGVNATLKPRHSGSSMICAGVMLVTMTPLASAIKRSCGTNLGKGNQKAMISRFPSMA